VRETFYSKKNEPERGGRTTYVLAAAHTPTRKERYSVQKNDEPVLSGDHDIPLGVENHDHGNHGGILLVMYRRATVVHTEDNKHSRSFRFGFVVGRFGAVAFAFLASWTKTKRILTKEPGIVGVSLFLCTVL